MQRAPLPGALLFSPGPLPLRPVFKLRDPTAKLRNPRPLIGQRTAHTLDLGQCQLQCVIRWRVAPLHRLKSGLDVTLEPINDLLHRTPPSVKAWIAARAARLAISKSSISGASAPMIASATASTTAGSVESAERLFATAEHVCPNVISHESAKPTSIGRRGARGIRSAADRYLRSEIAPLIVLHLVSA